MAVGVAATSAIGCGPDDLNLPPAPDTSALVAKYNTPTGTISTQNIDQVLSDAQARLAQLHLDWFPDLIQQELTSLRQRLDDSGISPDPARLPDRHRPNLEAVATLSQICRGWADPIGPANPSANGTLAVTAVINAGVFRRAVSGTATSCYGRVQPSNEIVVSNLVDVKAFVDGTFAFYFYNEVPATLDQAYVLVQLSGQLGTMAGGNASGEFDLVIHFPDIDVNLDRPDGNIILSVGVDGVTVRGANATYRCDAALQTCGPT